MSEKSLLVRLEAMDHRPGQFILSFNTSQYSITLNPEASITFSEWLRRLRPVLAGQRDPAGNRDPQDLLRNVGMWLWQALLPEHALAQEYEALVQAFRTGRTPLLLALPDTLAGLPWELLYDPEQPAENGFLALRRPQMRLSTSATAMTPIELPLRVLLLISSPPGLGEDSRIDVESERAVVEQAVHDMRKAGFLHLLVEDIVTPKRVQRHLEHFKPHIVHYIGHGKYNETGGGVLLWEDDWGNELALSAKHLVNLLRPWNIHAVVLHGCETGRSNEQKEMRGLADTLVDEGFPAVLAQQANFTYESSQLASNAWYTALTAGDSFVEALFKVRQALSKANRPDWAVPILQGNATSLVPLFAATSLPGSADPLLTSVGAAANLTTPNDVFVGRHRELRALHLMLKDLYGSGPVIALITGPGGIGKSTLAAQAAIRYGGTYKAALILRCQEYRGIDLFLQRIGEFLKQLGIPSFLEQCLPDPKLSIEAKNDEAVAALNAVGPVLLFIDNLESVQNDDQMISDQMFSHLLQTLFTNLRGGRVLITGRYIVKELLLQEKFRNRFLHLALEDLSPYETSQLLLRHPALARLSKVVRQKLVQEFGGLPYVYDLLSSKAAVEDLERIIYEVREYGAVKQKTITEERKQHTAEEWQTVHQKVVEFATLKVIINQISDASRTLLAKLGVLYRPFPLAAIEEGLGTARTAWQPLLDWSLLHYDPHEQTYHLHSLTRQYAESQLDGHDRMRAQAQLAAWYEHYAKRESHNLADLLEAHRLFRTSGSVQQAGELVMQLSKPLKRFGLHSLLCELCTTTLDDIRGSDEQLAANALDTLGDIAFFQGNYAEAHRLYLQSLETFERLDDQSERATPLLGLGTTAQEQGNYKEARKLYQQSLTIYERLGDQGGRATSLYHLGTIAQEQGNYKKARKLYQQSLAIFERLDYQIGCAASLHHLGWIAQKQGNYKEAQQFYQQSLTIHERIGDQGRQADSLYHLGWIAQEQGNYKETRKLYQQSLAIYERLGNQGGQADSLHGLGNIACSQENYEEARQFYQQSLTIKERLGDQSGCADTLHGLGNIACSQENYEEARQFYQQSLTIRERLGDQSGRAGTLHGLGNIAEDQGNYEEARQFYQQSLTIYDQLGEQSGRAGSLYQLGIIAKSQGDFEKALSYIVQAYILFDSLHSPYCATAQRLIVEIRSNMDEAAFTACWQTLAGGYPLPSLPTVGTSQQQTKDFLAELNRLCGEVVATLRTGNVEQQEALATRLEQILKDDLLMAEALDFLQVLFAWLREQDTQALEKKLQPPFDAVYAHMVTAVEQEETEDAEEDEGLIIGEVLDTVSFVILQGTTEQRQQIVTYLVEAQQELPPEEEALGRFFGCLEATLRGETPEIASLEPPFTQVWQEFQERLRVPSNEVSQQEEGKND